jgi:hypothetical protein
LKIERRTPSHEPALGAGSRRRHRVLWGVGLASVIGLYSVAVFVAGVGYYKVIVPEMRDLTGAMSAARAVEALSRGPVSWVAAELSPLEAERLDIDIKFEHLHKLHEKREEAMRRGVLVTGADDMVPAIIKHRGRSVRVKLRLKGDLTDHLDGDKWSMRVHVKGSDQIFGMRRFSLQAPKTRNFHLEALFHEHLRHEGVLALRYFFVEVAVNGKDIGLMAFEEHFGKELLESQDRREGVLVKFDESLFWDYRVANGQAGPFNNHYWVRVVPFAGGDVARSAKLSAELRNAQGLLTGFVRGELPARDVFDIEQLARFIAIAEVWRAPHALSWINVRFYYNPLTARLEPVGYDAKALTASNPFGLVSVGGTFPRQLLSDDDVREAFVAVLPRIAREMVDGTTAELLGPLQEELLTLLHREFPLLARFTFEVPRRHSERLIEINEDNFWHFDQSMGLPDHELVAPVIAEIRDEPSRRVLELVNTLPVEVSVASLRSLGASGAEWKPLALASGALPMALPPTEPRRAPTRIDVPLDASGNGSPVTRIEGIARVRGRAEPFAFVALPRPSKVDENPLPEASLEQALAAHPFLRHDGTSFALSVEPGVHEVDGWLVLPDRYGLTLPAGTRLRFETGRGLFARGPLVFRGSADAPVVLEPRAESFAGVFVVESNEPSTWTHVHVRNTTGMKLPGWEVTGAVTFRRNRVSLEDCVFADNSAEDALNIVRSEFSMRAVEIRDARSDAFDGDFVTGSIEGGHMTRIGGDGIDVSGSKIEVRGTRLSDVRDKAISVGEGSELRASDLTIERVGTALAVKDRSEARIEASTLSQISHVALMSYTKKPEFGGGSLSAQDLSIEGVSRLAVAQTGSRLEIDGEAVATEDVDIESLYKEGYMKK